MWYAASEIVFFLVVASVVGGLVGYGVGQIYQLDFRDLRTALASRKAQTEELAAARVEVADLRRKLDLMSAALREQPGAAERHPPSADASNPTDASDADVSSSPSTGHAVTEGTGSEGRRLSERVADAGGGGD